MSPTSGKLEPKSDSKTARSILLCGASVRSLAESAIAAGFRPICVDFFEDEDLKQLLSSGRGRFVGRIDSFAELPQRIRSIRHTIPLLWAGGLENHPDILREINRFRPVIGASPDAVDQLRNPWTLNHWLANAAIGSPQLARQGKADAHCHWLRKSVNSSGGQGIGLPTTSQSTKDTATVGDGYLQEYIDGVPMSALLCADSSGVALCGTALQLIGWPSLGASGFLFCGNIGPVDPGDAVIQQVLEAANIIVDRCGLRGIFGIDFVLRQRRAWLIEVNPRITASHMLYELQQPGAITCRHLAAFGWKSVRSRKSREESVSHFPTATSPVAARLILWAREDIQIGKGFGSEPDSTATIADRPQAGNKVPQDSPLCSIQVTGNNIDHAADRLRSMEKRSGKIRTKSFTRLRAWGYSTRAIADQMLLLWKKFIVSR